jgi:flagellar hook protein FlgE
MGILSSLYSGVSGLAANGSALTVIGNNIANNNTVGFKAGRSLFSDLLSSSISASSGTAQVGRGVGMSIVDNLFTQGTFENTSQDTDLAIEGDGFFIVRDPVGNVSSYTRAGAFRWDADGYLTSPEGYRVMGYSLNDAGNVTGDLTEVKVDTTTMSPPKSTENVTFTTNLDAASPYRTAVVGQVVGVYRTVGNLAEDYLDPNGGLTINGTPLDIGGGTTYNRGSAKEIASSIVSTPGLNAAVDISYGETSLGEVKYLTSEWELNEGDLIINDVPLKGTIPVGVDRGDYEKKIVEFFNTQLAAANDGLGVGVEVSIDSISHNLKLKSTDGSNIQLQVGENTKMTTRVGGLRSLLKTTTFSGVDIQADGLDIGKLTVNKGTDQDYGIIINEGTVGTDAGFDITDPTNTANYANSVTIYDSLGNPHQATVFFSKLNPTTNPREWRYVVTVDAEELKLATPQTGAFQISDGTLQFLEDGTLDPSVPNGLTTVSGMLSWNNNSARSVQLNIDFNTTQWSNDSVVISQSQDGYATGTVAQLSIDNEGNVLGNYSNGLPSELFQIALAKFSSPGGLTKAGSNMFQASASSGDPIVGTVGSGIGNIFTNSLEQSNVDLAAEFVTMITTQRGFQANSKIITTTDEMLSELINLKR